MKTYIFLTIFLVSHCLSSEAQDTLVYFQELTFHSPVEQKAFTDHFVHNKTDLFSLFMASGAKTTDASLQKARDRFYQHLTLLEGDKALTKRNDKKVKFIYDNIHDSFFRKYELKNSFEEIFTTGYYNCVSATALYALAFDKLHIPYVIKELPSHVYLVAFPKAEQIQLETTTPLGGFQSMNEAFKQSFVKMLRDQKMISAQEYATQDVNVLFDKFYFGDQQNITLLNLVGIQYTNDALYKSEEGKYLEALQQMEKGQLLFPSERTNYLLMTITSAAFDEHKQRDTLHATMLAKLARFEKYGITDEMVKGEFVNTIQELLFKESKKDQLAAYYNKLNALLTDEDLKNEITFLYQYENGRFHYNQAGYKEALPHFEAALAIKPNHVEVQTPFVGCLGQIASQQGDNLEALKSFERYSKMYPALHKNNIYNTLIASCYLIQCGTEYTKEKASQGDKYKLMFEEHTKKYPELAINSMLIGHAYSTAAVYYFRKGQTSKAKSILEKGLSYSPNNQELLIRQQMIGR